MRTSRPDRAPSRKSLQRCRCLQQVVPFQGRVLWDVMFPHVIGNFVPAARHRAQRLWIQLAYPARRKNRRFDTMRIEQLYQPPDADASPELTLGKLHRRLVQQSAQQHGIEIGGEVDRNASTMWPGQLWNTLVTRIVAPRHSAEIFDLLFKLAGHFPGVPLQRTTPTTPVDFVRSHVPQFLGTAN